jgi:hypothetical protein
MALFWLSAALQGFVSFSFPLARDRLASGQTASGEPAQQLLAIQADPVEQVGVLVGVDLVGKSLSACPARWWSPRWRRTSRIGFLSSCMRSPYDLW